MKSLLVASSLRLAGGLRADFSFADMLAATTAANEKAKSPKPVSSAWPNPKIAAVKSPSDGAKVGAVRVPSVSADGNVRWQEIKQDLAPPTIDIPAEAEQDSQDIIKVDGEAQAKEDENPFEGIDFESVPMWGGDVVAGDANTQGDALS